MVLMGWLLESGVDGAGGDSTNVSSVYNDLLASLDMLEEARRPLTATIISETGSAVPGIDVEWWHINHSWVPSRL